MKVRLDRLKGRKPAPLSDQILAAGLNLEFDHSQEANWNFISLLQRAVDEQTLLYVPILTSQTSELDEVDPLDLEMYLLPEKELFRKVDLEHGGQAYCAFLTVPEDQEGPAAEYRPIKAEEIFRAALEDPDCEGLILNPWDLSAMLTHELLALVLNEDGRSASCSLYINYGEVCDQDCDVIANIAEHPFEETEHDQKLIFDRGGEALRSVCAKLTPPKPGQIVVTSSGIGRSASIFHAALPEVIREESLHQLIDAILERALHMGYTSVSLPSIGNEIAPYLPEVPFAVLAVSGWFCRHPDSGMSVTISTRSKKTYDLFCAYLFDDLEDSEDLDEEKFGSDLEEIDLPIESGKTKDTPALPKETGTAPSSDK